MDDSKETIIDYTATGRPLTQEQLLEEVLKASVDVEAGNYTTQEDLERESKDW